MKHVLGTGDFICECGHYNQYELAFLSYGNMMEWVSISGRQHTNCFVGVPCFSVDGYDL